MARIIRILPLALMLLMVLAGCGGEPFPTLEHPLPSFTREPTKTVTKTPTTRPPSATPTAQPTATIKPTPDPTQEAAAFCWTGTVLDEEGLAYQSFDVCANERPRGTLVDCGVLDDLEGNIYCEVFLTKATAEVCWNWELTTPSGDTANGITCGPPMPNNPRGYCPGSATTNGRCRWWIRPYEE